MKNKALTTAALAAVIAGTLSMSIAQPSFAAGKEKCYGISKAGQNDCSNLAGTHSCAAQSTVDFDIGEYKVVDAGTCDALGGYSKEEARALLETQESES